MKKLFSCLLPAAILLTLSSVAFAGDFEPGPKGEGIFWDGGTVTLVGDVSVSNRIFVNGDTVLDLNGYTMTYTAADSILIRNNATLTVTGGGEIHHDNTANNSCLFFVSNTGWEFTEAAFDEEETPLFEGGVEKVSGGSRLLLEDGTYSSTRGDIIVVLEGAEAEIGTVNGCKLIPLNENAACIINLGSITAITNTEMLGAGVKNLGNIGVIDGCNITAPQNNIENFGKIGAITNTSLTSAGTDGGVALNNQGYIGTVGAGVKIDCAFAGIGNDSTHSTIDLVSLEYIRGGAAAIDNRGTIHTIAAGEFDAAWHGMENSGTVGLISGGSFHADIITHVQSTIKEISGGAISGRQCGLTNRGTVERITGGTFTGRWEDMEEAAKVYVWGIDNSGKIGTMSGYTADGDTGYGIRNHGDGEIGELGIGMLIGEHGKIYNEAVIHNIFDESILAGKNATGEAWKVPEKTGQNPIPEFTDMADHWAASDVSALAAAGIVNGFPDGTFGAAKNVTRGELAKLVLTVSGRKATGGVAAFADTEGTWPVKYVNGLAGVGIIRSDDYPKGFEQGNQATRMETITMLMRSMGYDKPAGEVTLSFNDAEGLTAEQAYYVDCAVRRGIIKGMPDGTLRPDESVSRAEAATMLRRVEEARTF